jgi:hypothetical protein
MYLKRIRHFSRGLLAWYCLASVVALWLCVPAPTLAAAVRRLHTLLKLPVAQGQAQIHRFRLPLRGLHVDVVDLGYERPLADALGDGDLVVNGGYWGWADERRRTLVGLLVAGGKQLSPLRESLSGGVLTLSGGRASISPSRGYVPPPEAALALQCRPRLLVARSVAAGLNGSARAARTAACVRDGGATLDIYVTDPQAAGITLQELAQWLLSEGCDHALNLDGGPSSSAAFRERGQLVQVGAGEKLPYALRFHY